MSSVGTLYNWRTNATNKPEYYLLTKKVKANAGEFKTETFQVGSFSKFLTLELNDPNIIEIESIKDTNGDLYNEVPYLAQDTIFEKKSNDASNDPDLYSYNQQTPYLLKIKNLILKRASL